MHKSLGNYVDTTMARGKYGADALRQWAAIGASTGSDIPFSWKDVEFGYRFMRKFWNAARFASSHLNADTAKLDPKELKFRPLDRWILSRLNRLVKQVTEWLEDFQFNRALGEIQNFVWHEFCDMYIEEVKHRLYGDDPAADAAKFTLYNVILTATKLLAPFVPHFSEEVYQTYFAKHYQHPSVHVSEWPAADEKFIDEAAERMGLIANTVVSALRQFKSERKMALSQELSNVVIYSPNKEVVEMLEEVKEDIAGTMRVREIEVTGSRPELEERVLRVEPNFAKLGPRLRGDVKLVAEALRAVSPEDVAEKLVEGRIVLEAAGRTFELVPDEVKVVKETESAGRRVEAVNVVDPVLTILITLT
jgi:valyl-tRNA synthetase